MEKGKAGGGVTPTDLVDQGSGQRTAPITFRLPEKHRALIESRAVLFGQTANHYAKQVVVRDLEQRGNEDVRRDLGSVRREIASLRDDVRRLSRRDRRVVPLNVSLKPNDPLPLQDLKVPRR